MLEAEDQRSLNSLIHPSNPVDAFPERKGQFPVEFLQFLHSFSPSLNSVAAFSNSFPTQFGHSHSRVTVQVQVQAVHTLSHHTQTHAHTAIVNPHNLSAIR